MWSDSHNDAPGQAGNLRRRPGCSRAVRAAPPQPMPQPEGGGDRNAIPLYAIPNARVVTPFHAGTPLRVSALRGLGAYMNVFAIESFMDELAALATGRSGRSSACATCEDSRARATSSSRAAERSAGAVPRSRPAAAAASPSRSTRISPAMWPSRSKSRSDRETGGVRVRAWRRRSTAARSSIPDGIAQPDRRRHHAVGQLDPVEQLRYDARRIASFDWSSYPIMRFSGVPERLDIALIDQPGEAFWGGGGGARADGGGAGERVNASERPAPVCAAAPVTAAEGLSRVGWLALVLDVFGHPVQQRQGREGHAGQQRGMPAVGREHPAAQRRAERRRRRRRTRSTGRSGGCALRRPG